LVADGRIRQFVVRRPPHAVPPQSNWARSPEAMCR
jgi:hypothetical protein